MFENILGFYETQYCFNDISKDYLQLAKTQIGKLLVKAHEKEIYELGSDLVAAKIHRDNKGVYPFSKLDFLSHKLQEIVFPQLVPKVCAADFSDRDKPLFIIEKIPLDKYHIAYNIIRQKVHQKEGLDYKYDCDFFSVEAGETIETLAQEHIKMVDEIKVKYTDLLKEKGIAFDYSYVNIAWRKGLPVALELHKCQRDYLFNYDICYNYFISMRGGKSKENGLKLLERIKQLYSSS